MMPADCEPIREQLNALVDGQLDAAQTAAVHSHLAECADCRAARDALEALDATLTQTLRPIAVRSAEMADRAVAQWQAELPTVAACRFDRQSAMRSLAAAAAGFLLAALLFGQRPVADQPVSVPIAVETPETDVVPTKPVVARVVLATGPLQFKSAAAAEWETVPAERIRNFTCPTDSCLRTERSALCELSTPEGGQIRLNEMTEVCWPADDAIELVGGQLWCQSSKDRPLRMTAAPTKPETTWTCATGSESLASVSPEGGFRVMAVGGEVDVTTDGARHSLTAGMVCASTAGEVSVRQSSEEFLLASRWMQPLMTREGHDNPELSRRVDAMLARIGRVKVSFLLEQDLRNLGEYGALPLLRFVQTAQSDAERERRQTAMRILADTAPIWMAPDLIALLEDADGNIRSSAATALTRLTRETQGLTTEDWQSDRSRWATGVAGWRDWWMRHSVSCALPPAGVPTHRELPPPEMLKARD